MLNETEEIFIEENFTQVNVPVPEFLNFRRDVRAMSAGLDPAAVQSLVDMYYTLQEKRMAYAAKARELEKAGSPSSLVSHYADTLKLMESSLKYPLQQFAQSTTTGSWAMSQYGIGPVLAAGLLSYIDITKAQTAGSIWRYAGLDPTSKWEKGQIRPFNAELKVLCWKIGQSFMKFSGKDQCFYGKLYLSDKVRRTEMNENGEFADRAKQILTEKNWKANQSRATLESGKLPLGQIDAQARRYAVKIFLSHYHEVAYQDHFGEPAPKPYILAHGDHVHRIEVPNSPF